MGHFTKQQFSLRSMGEATQIIIEEIADRGRMQLAILAGHFYLKYDEIQRKLTPAGLESIGDETSISTPIHLGISANDSFREGLIFRKSLFPYTAVAKIALLVNDHLYKSLAKSSSQIIPEDAFRRNYFHDENAIPSSFKSMISDAGLTIEETLIEWKNFNKHHNSAMPESSFILSEQSLEKRYKRKTTKRLESDKVFHRKLDIEGEAVYFTDAISSRSYCVLHGKSLGCFGVAFELLRELMELGNRFIVLFLPEDCMKPSEEAAEVHASINLAASFVVAIITHRRERKNEIALTLIQC